MIDQDYVRVMAQYNSWQNKQLMPVLKAMDQKDLAQDRGAFFGSILATANHLLWGDMMWMSRFDASITAPAVNAAQSTQMHPNIDAWGAERVRMDGLIQSWADGVTAENLIGDLTYFSGTAGREITAPLASSIVHFFNHQTHHRGQIHAMLTAAGQKAPVSDLILMPEDI